MKKNIIFGVVGFLAVIGVSVIVVLTNRQTPVTSQKNSNEVLGTQNESSSNPATTIGEGEVKLTADNWDQEITNFKGIAMVDMYLPTCPHCQVMGPIVSEIAKEAEGKYKIGKIDMTDNSDIGTKYNIESVPAFIFFKDGKEVTRVIGETTKENLLAKIQEISK